MSKQTKCTSGHASGESRMSLAVYCLLLTLMAGSTAMPATAQSLAASANLPISLRAGKPQMISMSNASLSIASVAEADRLLKDVEIQRGSIHARYKNEEAHCFTRFFVTSCIDDAKERRRVGLRSIRSIEVQADAFKRAYRAEQRDRELQRKKPIELPRPDTPRSEDVSMGLREAPRSDPA